MNVLQVHLARDHPFGGFGVRLVIDGRDLVDHVREYERAFAGELAGSYGLLPAADTLPPARHFLGASEPYYSGGPGRTLLLACECGEPGCWPLEASIRTDDRTVTWTEFGQPHRPQWSYDGFGPFVFDRAAYEVALAEAALGHWSISRTALTSHDAELLLWDLCVKLGFCLPVSARQRLQDRPPLDPDTFTDAVFRAEGLDPATADRRLYQQVHAMIASAFRRANERDA